jgi:hypothetical protein
MNKSLHQLRIERDNYDISLLPSINTTKLVEQTADCLKVFLSVAAKCREGASLDNLRAFWLACVAVARVEHETARVDFRLDHWNWTEQKLDEEIAAARRIHALEKERKANERWLAKGLQQAILSSLETGPRRSKNITTAAEPEQVARSLAKLKKLGKVTRSGREWSLTA